MPAIATGNNSCEVHSPDGSGKDCKYPMTTSTDECSSKVFVGGIGVVCQGDKVAPHNKKNCVSDESTLTTYSSKVFIGGKGVGRIGDKYGNNVIISSSGTSKVFCG